MFDKILQRYEIDEWMKSTSGDRNVSFPSYKLSLVIPYFSLVWGLSFVGQLAVAAILPCSYRSKLSWCITVLFLGCLPLRYHTILFESPNNSVPWIAPCWTACAAL